MIFRVFRAMRAIFLGTLVLGILAVALGVFSTSVNAVEGINERINFQGRLLTHEGATVPDGYYNVEFKIYQDGDGQTAGNATGSPAGTLEWTEAWLNNDGNGVKVRNGYFSVELGSVTAFGSSVDWNQDTLYLSINIGDTVTTCTPFSSCNGDGEMLPMKRLSATPYALNAGKLGGRTADGFIQNNAGTPQAANISIQSADAGDVAAVIQGAAGQTADIFQVTADSVGTPLLAVSNTGSVTITPTSDASAALTVNSTSGTIFSASATEIALNEDSVLAANKDLTFTAGTGNFDQSASTGTFETGTGAATLNGDTTLVNGKTLAIAGNTAFQKGTDFSATGSSNDVNFGSGTLFRLTGASAQAITGIAGGVDGRTITFVNAGVNSATIVNNSGLSSAANRIITGSGGDITLTVGSGLNLIYDSSDSVWRVVGSAGGAAITLQDAYDNSATTDPQIQLNATNGGIKIQDASSTVGNILQVQNDTGSGTYFAVTAGGVLVNALDSVSTATLNIGSANAASVSIGKTDGSAGITLSSNTITTGTGTADTTLIKAAQTTADTAGTRLTIQGSTGNGTGNGGTVTVQGGTGGATNGNGGDLELYGGTGVGTGVTGLVRINTAAYATAATQNSDSTTSGINTNITQTNVDNYGALVVNATGSAQSFTLGDPTLGANAAGRVIYVTAANGSEDFTLIVNGGGTGNQIAMRANTTATMIWNGSDWTAAGASSSTTLQSAYDNTLQSAGGAELVVSSSGNTNGLTIRDSSTSPVNGRILTVQTSSAADLISVNSNVTEYASDAGAEVAGATDTSFPANTWSAISGATVSRHTTAGDYIATGQGSVSVVTDTSAGSGVKNQLTTALTAKTTYNVSFAVRLDSSSSSFTDLEAYYSADGSAASVSCMDSKVVPTSVWTKVNCTFTAPDSGISASNAIFIRQTGAGTSHTMYVDNLSVTIAADYNYATDGSVNDNTNFSTNWTSVGGATVTRDTLTGYDASDSAETITTGTGQGVRNKLSINPLESTLYRITVYAALDSGTFDNFTIRYSRDGGSNFQPCADYNTQTIATGSTYTKVTCYVETDSTAATDPYVYFTQTDGTARTFHVDTFSMSLSTITTPNVQIGGGINGGPTTLFTLDRGASAPIASDNDALLGSMYYDTTLGKLQCYEADGWGACGSSPDNIITISPEYTNAVLHGPSGGATGVGTMTSDFCSDYLNINNGTYGDDVCGTDETYNFYKWTSPQATNQTYAIYVTYQLPDTFKQFASGQTSIMGRTDVGPSSGTAEVSYKIYRNSSSGLTQCAANQTGTEKITVSSGSVSVWQIGIATGAQDPSTCGFTAGDSIVFEIDVSAYQNANAYVGNLNFTFSNR